MSPARCIVDGTDGPLVRRKILVFRRLEPGDVRATGARAMPESPYVEAKLLDLAVGKDVHDDMVRLHKLRESVLDAGASMLHRYDLPGIVIAGAGAGIFGTYFDYVPERFRTGLFITFVVGVVLAFVTRSLRKAAEEAALARWRAMPESREHDELAADLLAGWERFQAAMKREHPGFHAELRVAEGSGAPERLCSIDPRPFADRPPRFDPEDWLPTEGGGVRYEVVDGMGEIVTRALDGVDDVPTEADTSEPAPSDERAPDGEDVASADDESSGDDDDDDESSGDDDDDDESADADAEPRRGS